MILDTLGRLRQLLDDRNWTEYRLAKASGLSDSTIKNIFKRNTQPTIETLEAVCRGLGITLAQFFADEEMVELTPDLKELFILAIATSIDALAVGLSFGCTGYDTLSSIILPITIIAIGSFLFSAFGFVIGAYVGKKISFPVEILAGVILIVIGTKILIEHLTAL